MYKPFSRKRDKCTCYKGPHRRQDEEEKNLVNMTTPPAKRQRGPSEINSPSVEEDTTTHLADEDTTIINANGTLRRSNRKSTSLVKKEDEYSCYNHEKRQLCGMLHTSCSIIQLYSIALFIILTWINQHTKCRFEKLT